LLPYGVSLIRYKWRGAQAGHNRQTPCRQGWRIQPKEHTKFSLPELEDAAKLNHAAFPRTPQIAWPLLAQRAGTAPLAALLQERERTRGKRVALVVIIGGNIDLDLFRTWVLA
jgi:threonine dehydratase